MLTVQTPAADATKPEDISIGFVPFVLLKMAPLSAPAAMLLAASSAQEVSDGLSILATICNSTHVSPAHVRCKN